MSRLRFKAGDLAEIVVARVPADFPYIGSIVVVAVVGPFDRREGIRYRGARHTFPLASDYLVETVDTFGVVCDWQLRPITPPAEPATLTRCTDLQEPVTA